MYDFMSVLPTFGHFAQLCSSPYASGFIWYLRSSADFRAVFGAEGSELVVFRATGSIEKMLILVQGFAEITNTRRGS